MTKYHAKPVVVDNIRFHSTKEANRYKDLCLLEKAGKVSHITRQRVFTLDVNGRQIGKYLCDFEYYDVDKREVITEDVKGFDTPLSKWKRRHVKAQYGIEVLTT